MKRLIVTTLLLLMTPIAIAGHCMHDSYDRNFFIYGDSSLPALKIMSVTPGVNQRNLSAATQLTPEIFEIRGFKINTCEDDLGLNAMSSATNNAKMPKDDVTVTVRVGYDDNHYVDVMLYIRSSYVYDFQTNILPINPVPHGIAYVFKSIPQSNTGNVSLTFTKKGN